MGLFSPITIRDLKIPNRLWMAPMGTWAAETRDGIVGHASDFHLSHYGARAAGGAGLVMVESTAVSPEGRTSPFDLGLWEDGQIASLARIASAISDSGAVPAIQLHHGGRKASTDLPWAGEAPLGVEEGGWPVVAPSKIAGHRRPVPRALTVSQIDAVVEAFQRAACRARNAGFQAVEIHAAHGYLLHSFLSPVANVREDEYGGSLENRSRLTLRVIEAVRSVWDPGLPVILRISATDWIEEQPDNGRRAWTVKDSVQLARWAGGRGIDLIDVSSGGIEPVPIPAHREYQSSLAAKIRSDASVRVGATGRIEDPVWANELIESRNTDVVLIGRKLLRDASWANNVALELGVEPRYLERYAHFLRKQDALVDKTPGSR